MQRAVKPTGEWCKPTAELTKPKLLQLLHTVKTTPDESEIEIEFGEPELEESAVTLVPEFEESAVTFVPDGTPEPIVDAASHSGSLEHPWFIVDDLSAEEEESIALAEPLLMMDSDTGVTSAVADDDDEVEMEIVEDDAPPPRMVVAPPPTPKLAMRTPMPTAVYRKSSGTVLGTFVAIVLVVGAAAGGVFLAMTIVPPL